MSKRPRYNNTLLVLSDVAGRDPRSLHITAERLAKVVGVNLRQLERKAGQTE